MAEATRNAQAMKEMEERLSSRLDNRLAELAGTMQRTISESLKKTMDDLLQQHLHGSPGMHHHESRNSGSYSCGTRLARIDFPRFNGENVNQWLYQCNNFFSIDNTPDPIRVQLAIVHLEGRALQWHTTLSKTLNCSSLCWADYAQLVIARFGDVCDDPMAELMQLRQKSSVVEYHKEFDSIITRLSLPENYTLSCFLARMYEAANAPTSLSNAKNVVGSSNNAGIVKNQKGLLGVKPVSAPKPIPSTSSQKETATSKFKTGKTLTPTFMSERRANGLCYFCDEPYSHEHSLTHKKLQVHVLEVLEDKETVEEPSVLAEFYDADELQISVHALSGVANFKTMRVTGHYQKHPVHILIDSGSTHNFLDIGFAKRYGCRIEDLDPINVVVADGYKLPISSIVRNFTWRLQNTIFTSDIMLIPLGGYDLVLGIEWLVTLGDIVWNFEKLQMEFKINGKRHVLRGSAQGGIKTIRKQQVGKVLAEGVHLSMIHLCGGGEGLLQSLTAHSNQPQLPPRIVDLLTEFDDSDLVDKIRATWLTDMSLRKLIKEIQEGSAVHKHYTWHNEELRRKGRLVVGNDSKLREELLQWLHSSGASGHSGINATMQRIKVVLHWKGLTTDVPVSSALPYQSEDALADKDPKAILDRMTVRRKGVAVTKVLVKWKHQLAEDATWEFYYDLKKKFPSFHP
ncbi:Retrotransposon gag domain [Sesbania bispinosa]|nr:Retrotransposon gag domain [Sesbania bispinosa]